MISSMLITEPIMTPEKRTGNVIVSFTKHSGTFVSWERNQVMFLLSHMANSCICERRFEIHELI